MQFDIKQAKKKGLIDGNAQILEALKNGLHRWPVDGVLSINRAVDVLRVKRINPADEVAAHLADDLSFVTTYASRMKLSFRLRRLAYGAQCADFCLVEKPWCHAPA